MTKWKRYSAEFKAKMASETIRKELTMAELAKKYDIHPTMITGWKRATMRISRNWGSDFTPSRAAIPRSRGYVFRPVKSIL